MAKLQYADIIETDPKYRALAELSTQLARLPIEQVMTTLIDLLDDEHIGLLAEKWSVTGNDGILLADSQQNKRKLIQGAIELHQHKGTPWVIREVLDKLGFGEIEIDEGLKARQYEQPHIKQIPENERWAYYAIRLQQPITNEQAELIRKTIRSFAPARCTLAVLDYRAVQFRYNRKITYNGQYNYGSS